MSKIQTLRDLVNQRLSAAAEEIFELFERTISEYEEQLSRSKEDQQKLLDAVYNPEVRLHRADIQQLLVSKDEDPPDQQEWSPSVQQEDSEPPHIKEEQEKLWSSQEGEQPPGQAEEDISVLFPPVPVKSEEDDGEKLQPSQIHEHQTFESDTDDSSGDWGNKTSQVDVEALQNERESETLSSSDHATGSGTNGLKPKRRRKAQKPFSCSICKKTFQWRGDMETHMRVHTGERPFQCSICGSKFTRSYSLHSHFRVHTGEKPFTCSVCQTSFSRKNTLDIHMRSHTGEKPFVCSICGKTFPTQRNLTRHSIVHTKEKLFDCSVCSKKFAQKFCLKRHMAIHEGEKPFGCPVCRRTFAQKFCLKRHLNIHRKNTA